MLVVNNTHKKRLTKFANFLKHWYILLVLVLIYIPLVLIIFLSFNGQNKWGSVKINFGVPTTINWIKIWGEETFTDALINTIIISLIVVPVTLLIAVFACYGIWKAKVSTKFMVLNSSRLSIVTPDSITGVSLILLFGATWIPIGFDYGFFTVVLAHISFCTPYALIAIYPRINKMNPNWVLASYDLGNGKFNTFFKVIIPYLMPSILSALAIVLAMSWDDFIITNLVNGSFQTIGTAIYTTRKGIKAWVVTFGAIMVIGVFFTVLMIHLLKTYKEHKRNIRNGKK